MSQSARVQEPSMEEILASIRRIIADEGNTPQPTRPAPAANAAPRAPEPPPPAAAGPTDADALLSLAEAPAPGEEADVLDLTQAVEPASNSFRSVSGADVVFRDGEQARQAAPPPSPPPLATEPPASRRTAVAEVPAPMPRPASTMMDTNLLSPTAQAAASAAFNSLANTILTEKGRTLEDLVREMMRPMLKQWLDDNLPGLVERMVRAEIERVARGGS